MQRPRLDYKALGGQIRRRRKYKRLTQTDLARMSGISLSFLGHIERGSRKASLETLLWITTALDTTPNDVLSDSIIVTTKDELSQSSTNGVLDEIKRLIDEHLIKPTI